MKRLALFIQRGVFSVYSVYGLSYASITINQGPPRLFFITTSQRVLGSKNKKCMKYCVFLSLFLIGLSTSAQVPNYVPTDGLVGWYPFNGNANDESGNGNNGTVNGATLTQDRFGAINSAYSFDGVNDYVIVENNPELESISDLSISGWININELPNSNSLLSGVVTKWYGQLNCGNQSDSYAIWVSHLNEMVAGTNQYQFYGNQQNVLVSESGQLQVQNWVHFTLVHSTQLGGRLFLNGLLVNDNSLVGEICGSTNPLFFGCDYGLGNPNRFLNGQLDDIGIWNRALTEEEIQGLYNAGICYDHVTVTDTLVINFNMTGFNPVTYEHSIEIYPNPTSDHVTINYGDFVGLNGYTLSIFNPMGQLVHTSNITQQQEYLDLNSWGGMGVYQVVVYNPQGVPIETRLIVLQ